MSKSTEPVGEDDSARRARAEEDAWAQIVANFGDRVTLDAEPGTTTNQPGQRAGWPLGEHRSETPAAPAASAPRAPSDDVVLPDASAFADPDPVAEREQASERSEKFVPPTPPPLPRPRGLRGAAWVGVLGVPVLFLLTALSTLDIPNVVLGLLVGWCAVGFVYLVATMTPGGGREPWDDGSRV